MQQEKEPTQASIKRSGWHPKNKLPASLVTQGSGLILFQDWTINIYAKNLGYNRAQNCISQWES